MNSPFRTGSLVLQEHWCWITSFNACDQHWILSQFWFRNFEIIEMILSSHDKSLSNNFAINFRPSRSPVAKIIFDIIAILYGNFQNHKNSSENVFWSSKHTYMYLFTWWNYYFENVYWGYFKDSESINAVSAC